MFPRPQMTGLPNSSAQEKIYNIAENFENFLPKNELKKLIMAIHGRPEKNILKKDRPQGSTFASEENLTLVNEKGDKSWKVKIQLIGPVSDFYTLFENELKERMDQVDSDSYRIKDWHQNISIYENEQQKETKNPVSGISRNTVTNHSLNA